MTRRKQPARKHEISIEYEGKTYHAQYHVESGMVIVETLSEDMVPITRATQIGGSTAENVARMLLRHTSVSFASFFSPRPARST